MAARRKLTAAQVAEIRASDERLDVLAERYHVARATISRARTGHVYRELPDIQPQRMATPHYGALPIRLVDCGYRHPSLRVDDCWLWCGPMTRDGYGMTSKADRSMNAHRRIYEEWFGPVPDGLTLDHLCRTRSCVNPFHLEATSHAENVHRGERCKLDWSAVDEIRASTVPVRQLARLYDVAPSTIQRCREHRTWREETRPTLKALA